MAFVFLALVLAVGGYLRLVRLGERSLWLDELCTWHVSRMDLGDSLRWEPELTIPPLYQFVVRAITDDPRPPEGLLRLPAAMAGIVSLAAVFWLGGLAGHWAIGVAAAGLLACNLLQIDYSQEARPYTLLVLGATVSMAAWYRLVVRARWLDFLVYVVVTTLTFHAHFLAAAGVAAQVLWWLLLSWRRGPDRRALRPLAALAVTGGICTPIILRTILARGTTSHALSWIEPPTWERAFVILRQLTYGWHWVLIILLPGAALALVGLRSRVNSAGGGYRARLAAGPEDLCGLLLIWLAGSWLGLLVVSWVLEPMLVARYALPAAVPALLLPLIVGHRLHRGAPLVILGLFVAGTAPNWINRSRVVEPGFRELTRYVQDHVDPEQAVVVLTLDEVNYPGWADMERLGFAYYPLNDRPIHELRVPAAGVPPDGAILEDPRALYVVVFRADILPVLAAAGRQVTPIRYEGESFSRLLFPPYRLIRVAPLRGD